MVRLSYHLINVLERRYGPLWPWHDDETHEDPFKNLILTILSQNTSTINCNRAYGKLAERFEITPRALAYADEDEVKEAIKSGGLYNIKTKRIKEVSKIVLEKYGGDVNSILSLPKEEAKERLVEVPGIGNKTADVLLTDRYTYREVIPIDTHMNRVTRRLGLVDSKAGYDEVQEALMDFIPKEKRDRTAGLIWLLAKHTCRAQNPKCYECPLINLCKYENKIKIKNSLFSF